MSDPAGGSATSGPVVFLHVPKTGGSTLHRALTARFGAAHVGFRPGRVAGEPSRHTGYEDRDPDDAAARNRFALAQWEALPAERRAGARIVTGHVFFGFHTLVRPPGAEPRAYLTLLRAPLPRIRSLYAHRVRNGTLAPGFEQYLAAGEGWALDNAQVRRWVTPGRGARSGRVTATMCDDACANLVAHGLGVGVTERFDESLVVIARALGVAPFPYETTNRGAPALVQETATPAVVDDFVARNEFDAALHAVAGTRLDDALGRLDRVGDLEALARANRRNRWLRTVREPARIPRAVRARLRR